MEKAEAIKILKYRHDISLPFEREALETLIPELKESEESEEERVRKDIVGLIKFALNDGSAVSPGSHTTKEEAISWLEKQKKLFESGRGLYYYDGEKTTYCGYPATEENPYDFAMSQQEKQKEHQNNSDAPNESSWAGMISSSDKDKNLDEIAQDYINSVKEYNPEPTWDLIQTAVCYGYHCCEQKEQKPAKWSEEDEDKLEQCIRIVSGWEGDYDIVKSPYSNFLKSLRPSWKPSEEQMEALKKVTGNAVDADEYYPALATLYYELKEQF